MDRRLELLPVVAGVGFGLLATLVTTFPAAATLRTLVLAQASLLAIVVSVSLLSIQVAGDATPLVSYIYRSRGYQDIIARFGLSIVVSLALFGVVGALGGGLPQGIAVGLGVALAAWSFLALLAVENRLLAFIDPEPVLEELVDAVSFERFDRFDSDRVERGVVGRNPVLEIYQLARRKLDSYDEYGALRAVVALDRATVRIIEGYAATPPEGRADSLDSLHKLFDYWDQIAAAAVEDGADDVLHAIVDAEATAAITAIEHELPDVPVHAVEALGRFRRLAVEADRGEPRYDEALGRVLAAALDAGGADHPVVDAVRAELDSEAATGDPESLAATLAAEPDR
ncbi:hypothetical protein [Haloarchaeobius amylolyticus]|uniref:hypothetical protein n=1 Tax=Haloarchaeobius amylolyticus TaxID=1198296 RepID=UPI00226EE43E|nr:hypothetical protein [Haloarchaeobius amylolyticus]